MYTHTQRCEKDERGCSFKREQRDLANTDRNDTGSSRTLHECLSESSAVGWNGREGRYAVLQLDLRRKSNKQTYDPN